MAENTETLLAHANDLFRQGEYAQASGKIWDAIAQAFREIAERHGWPNESARDLGRISGYLASVSGDEEVNAAFETAYAFRGNLYEPHYQFDQVEDGLRRAAEAVGHVRKAGAQVDAGALAPDGSTSPEDYYARDYARRREQRMANPDFPTFHPPLLCPHCHEPMRKGPRRDKSIACYECGLKLSLTGTMQTQLENDPHSFPHSRRK